MFKEFINISDFQYQNSFLGIWTLYQFKLNYFISLVSIDWIYIESQLSKVY